MCKAPDVFDRVVGQIEDRMDAAHQSEPRVGGRAWDFRDVYGACRVIHRNNVGESTASVDSDSNSRVISGLRHSLFAHSSMPGAELRVGVSCPNTRTAYA